MDSEPKAAAAMAAVMTYIRDQEAATAAHHAPVALPADIYRQLEALYHSLRPLFEGR